MAANQKIAHIASLRARYYDLLIRKKHVVSVSVGPAKTAGEITGEYAIMIAVDKKIPLHELAPEDRLPTVLESVPVIVHQIGALETL